MAALPGSWNAAARSRSALCSSQWRITGSLPKGQHTVIAAAIRQAFDQSDQNGAAAVWRHVSDQQRSRSPKRATLMSKSKADVLADMAAPALHRSKLHSTNPLERLNTEVTHRVNIVGIFLRVSEHVV